MINIINWLKEIRADSGKTQKEIAELCDVVQQYYCLVEAGERIPSVVVAKKLAKALDFKKYGFNWTKFYENELEKEEMKT